MNNIPIDPYVRKKIEPICCHEAGHYIIARVLGFKVSDIRAEITGIPNGHDAYAKVELANELSSKDKIISYLEKRTQILFAGPLSQALSDGKINNDEAIKSLENEGKSDHEKSREFIHLLRNIKIPEIK